MSKNRTHKWCASESHHESGSPHPRNHTPIEDFIGNDLRAKEYSQCHYCRTYCAKIRKAVKEERIRAAKRAIRKNSKYRHCPYRYHVYISYHKVNEVPKEKFESNDPKEICSDCKNRHEWKEKGVTYFFCSSCARVHKIRHKYTNVDGKPGKVCKPCGLKNRTARRNLGEDYKTIGDKLKIENIIKNEASCNKCKRIFLVNPNSDKTVLILETFVEDGERLVEYEGEIYDSREFVKCYSGQLELCVLDYDHLPEDELRERGILKDGEKYVGKRNEVANLKSEMAKRKEIKWCDLLCCECHRKITSLRYIEERKKKGKEDRVVNTLTKQKMEYSNELKRKGCECCKHVNKDVLSFFEFDHTDPKTKICAVSEMVSGYKYKMDNLIEEIEKCEVKCGFCHRLTTRRQIKNSKIKRKTVEPIKPTKNIAVEDISELESEDDSETNNDGMAINFVRPIKIDNNEDISEIESEVEDDNVEIEYKAINNTITENNKLVSISKPTIIDKSISNKDSNNFKINKTINNITNKINNIFIINNGHRNNNIVKNPLCTNSKISTSEIGISEISISEISISEVSTSESEYNNVDIKVQSNNAEISDIDSEISDTG